MKMTEIKKIILKASTIIATVFCAAFIIYGFKTGLFSSEEKLKMFLMEFKGFAPLIFIGIQALQVVIPILPFALGLVVGVLVFGSGWGFLYNYIGISLGSILAFLIAKRYGRPFLTALFGGKLVEKYHSMTQKKGFTKAFALSIFLPLAPDDFLCYLAGTTSMSLATFSTIILLGKPISLFVYTFGLKNLLSFVF